ncbi:MAG: hypothetical protein WBO35_02925 [Candidatus Saccharimonadales bacterium]
MQVSKPASPQPPALSLIAFHVLLPRESERIHARRRTPGTNAYASKRTGINPARQLRSRTGVRAVASDAKGASALPTPSLPA